MSGGKINVSVAQPKQALMDQAVSHLVTNYSPGATVLPG